MKKFLKSEPVRRAIRTFIQAACGYIVMNVLMLDFNSKNAVKGFVVAAIAAGLAAAMNLDYDKGGTDDEQSV
ncbi:MAG: hypothetical protein J6Y64_11020 [Ruminococcus sp.]|nr:hypothetical protein [Ruminococcus sp.]